jgi:class 3 adenylate cyclase
VRSSISSVRRFVLDAEDIELTRQLTAGTTALSFGEEKSVAILFADIRGFTLGLAIARQIVEEHGGDISADSPGKGERDNFHRQVADR